MCSNYLNNETICKALSLISTLGCDMKQADGKFRFIVYERVVEFFQFLHTIMESYIKPSNIAIQKENILIECLENLAGNNLLKVKWEGATSLPSDCCVLCEIKTTNNVS